MVLIESISIDSSRFLKQKTDKHFSMKIILNPFQFVFPETLSYKEDLTKGSTYRSLRSLKQQYQCISIAMGR